MLVNIIGLLAIVFVVFWFWPRSSNARPAAKDNEQLITVNDGVYEPEQPVRKAGESITLTFLRKDASACAQWVLFDDVDVSAELPINKAFTLQLPPLKPGNYPFHCQMNMYRGTLVVK
ncbi:cupredoxin domain-containing protein [Gallaecimonas mangrovi]|uniref:cupredoxin domain-containing protein n=1 Tax=Gallaecimonas mangrovi TaxID=2291597 RepID=UPI000E206962|nr:cupredoxin domain-containing protein [Gallaecimonas mangrovi]